MVSQETGEFPIKISAEDPKRGKFVYTLETANSHPELDAAVQRLESSINNEVVASVYDNGIIAWASGLERHTAIRISMYEVMHRMGHMTEIGHFIVDPDAFENDETQLDIYGKGPEDVATVVGVVRSIASTGKMKLDNFYARVRSNIGYKMFMGIFSKFDKLVSDSPSQSSPQTSPFRRTG